MSNNQYTPDRWAILKFITEEETYYKVLGGWLGGYLTGDAWRINSGIERVIVHHGEYHFVGYSGSVYVGRLGAEGCTGLMHNIVNQLVERYGNEVSVIPVEQLISELGGYR